MPYSDVKAQFTGILNRRDITPSLINTFVSQAIQRINRSLRTRDMEKTVSYVLDGSTNLVAVPTDMIELIEITCDSPRSVRLTEANYETTKYWAQMIDEPKVFYRIGTNYLLGPYPAAGLVVTLRYYGKVATPTLDADTSWLTEYASDLLVYGALSYAADFYLDNRKLAFEQRFVGIMTDVQLISDNELLTGGAAMGFAYDISDPI